MLVDFSTLTDKGRVWVYQAHRKFTDREANIIAAKTEDFINGWSAHGAPVKGSFSLDYSLFLIIGADENFNAVSGCSIDSSVHFVKELESILDLNFFDRSKVAVKKGADLVVYSLEEMKYAIQAGSLHDTDIFFNNTITTKSALESSWQIRMMDSWPKRYFKKKEPVG